MQREKNDALSPAVLQQIAITKENNTKRMLSFDSARDW